MRAGLPVASVPARTLHPMKTRTIIPLVVVAFALAQVQAATPAITDLAATQRPGTKFVDIAFSLSAETSTVSVLLEISSDGGSTWAVPATSTSGDIGTSVPIGTGKLITWDAGTDWDNQSSNQMQFRLKLDDGLIPAGFALIPSGAFTMGRTSGDTDTNAPPVTINLSSFHMQTTEVPWGQWKQVRTWALEHGYTDLGTGEGTADNYPVNKVTWWDVIKWCNARSEMEGLTPCYTSGGAVFKTESNFPAPLCNWGANGYRMPTEAEWEKAARGGLGEMRFPWGDTITHSNANYNVAYSITRYGPKNTYSYDLSPTRDHHPVYGSGAPVGTFPANGYGLTEMAGNVQEWCWDAYDASYYDTINGTTDPRGPVGTNPRMTRGGNCFEDAPRLRACERSSATSLTSTSLLGFRTSRTVGVSFTSPSMVLETRSATISLAIPIPTNGTLQGAGSYILNTIATLTATADPGYVITSWTGDATGTNNPLSITMDANKTVGATFAPALSDNDGDGLTNFDEVFIHGSNPLAADTDGDGFTDSFEINYGFSPTSDTSTPDAILNIRMATGTNTTVEFRFNAATGVNYRIEDSTDLSNWNTAETNIVGASNVVTRLYSIENLPKRYFRVRRN